VIALVVPLALSHVLTRCAPAVGPVTMSAIVAYESGGRPYAIGDNTVRRSYFPPDSTGAQALAMGLLRAGHNIDVGYAQINSANFRRYDLSLKTAFDPCTNVATGADILRRAYAGAARAYGAGQVALVHALSAYNTGGYFAGMAYARGVYAEASALRFERGPSFERMTLASRAAPGARAVTFVPARRAPSKR